MKKLLVLILIWLGVFILLRPVGEFKGEAVGNIVYRRNLVTGIITADNGDKSYAVEIGESGKSIKKIFTLSPDPDLAVGDKARIFYRGGNKEDMILLAPTKPAISIILFENYLAPSAIEFSYFYANSWWRGQTFTTTSAHTINYIELLLARRYSSSVPGTIYVEIRKATASDIPTGDILTSGETDGDTLTYALDNPGENREWRRIDLTEYNLENDTKYVITLHLIGGDSTHAAGIWGKSSPWGNDYPDGKLIYSTNGGVNWSTSFVDGGFKIYGKAL